MPEVTHAQAKPSIGNSAVGRVTVSPRVAVEVWNSALAKVVGNWNTSLATGVPETVAVNDSLKTTAATRYRYIFESLSDRSPAHRARIAQLLYQVELSEYQTYLAAKELKIQDTGEIQRRKDENAESAIHDLIINSGADGAKIADLIRLRHTMGDMELFVRPTMEFNNAPLSVSQQIEVARVLDRYGYNGLRSAESIRSASSFILNDCSQVLSRQQVRALAGFLREGEAVARGPGG
jgi:hypothetical protein